MVVCRERGVFSYREDSSFTSGFALRPDRQTRIYSAAKRFVRQIAAGREWKWCLRFFSLRRSAIFVIHPVQHNNGTLIPIPKGTQKLVFKPSWHCEHPPACADTPLYARNAQMLQIDEGDSCLCEQFYGIRVDAVLLRIDHL